MAEEYHVAFEGYKGKCLWLVQHPKYQGQDLTVAAPDDNTALVAAAERWGERWQDLSYYAYCTVTRLDKPKKRRAF